MNASFLKIAALLLVCTGGMVYAQLPKTKLSPPQKPTIVFDTVEIINVTMQKTDVVFVYIVDNPNSFAISNVLADYELFLKGNSTAVGKDVKFAIPANSKSQLKLPLEINYVHVFKSAEELTKAVLAGEKTIPFRLDITFKIDLKVSKFQIPISTKGELPLPEVKTMPDLKVNGKAKP
jgi:LEA14-like dessication related protein